MREQRVTCTECGRIVASARCDQGHVMPIRLGLKAWDFDNTLFDTGVLTKESYRDKERLLAAKPSAHFDEFRESLKGGYEAAIITGREVRVRETVWKLLHKHQAWGRITLYMLPEFPGMRELAFWKGGVLDALPVNEWTGDHEVVDGIAAEASGTPFRMVKA